MRLFGAFAHIWKVATVDARTLAPGARCPPLAASSFAEDFPGRDSPVDFR